MEPQTQLPSGISPGHKVYIGTTSMMTFLSTLFVALRLTSRALSVKIKADDWACVGALVFAYSTLVTTVLNATVGRSGYHLMQYDRTTLERRSKIILANNVLYNSSVSLSKTSILLFYRRIFKPSTALLYATGAMGSLVFGYWCTTVFGLIFSYSPVEAQWKPWVPHTSINNQAFWMSMGIVNIVLDLMILAMPQPLVWRLRMSRQRKVLLTVLFALGGFVCVASIVRVYYLSWADTDDLTHTLYLAGIWTMIETNMSIICACLPMIPGLLKAFKRRSGRGMKIGNYGDSRTHLRPLQVDGGKSSKGPDEPYALESLPSAWERRTEWRGAR